MKYKIRQAVKLAPAQITTVNIPYPSNYFRVVNGGDTSIYCGVQALPTEKIYDFRVKPGTAKLYGDEQLFKQLYIFNPSSSEVEIMLLSFLAEFDPLVLAVNDAFEDKGIQTVQVEIDGFKESLPAGTNNIGKVSVNEMPAEYVTILNNILSACREISGKLTDAESVGY